MLRAATPSPRAGEKAARVSRRSLHRPLHRRSPVCDRSHPRASGRRRRGHRRDHPRPHRDRSRHVATDPDGGGAHRRPAVRGGLLLHHLTQLDHVPLLDIRHGADHGLRDAGHHHVPAHRADAAEAIASRFAGRGQRTATQRSLSGMAGHDLA